MQNSVLKSPAQVTPQNVQKRGLHLREQIGTNSIFDLKRSGIFFCLLYGLPFPLNNDHKFKITV